MATNNAALAKKILEAANTEKSDSSEDYEKMARKEAGNAFLRALESGDGEAVAEALSNLSRIAMD